MPFFNAPSKSSVLKLLSDADLPVDDIEHLNFDHFFGFGDEQSLLGIIGLEMFESVALLRSLVVSEHVRGTGCGKKLVAYVEDYARVHGIEALYLLTTTAEDFFAGLGYQLVDRSSAPVDIAKTREFSGICPGSAAFMTKNL